MATETILPNSNALTVGTKYLQENFSCVKGHPQFETEKFYTMQIITFASYVAQTFILKYYYPTKISLKIEHFAHTTLHMNHIIHDR